MRLRSARPFWPVRDGLPSVHPPLEEDASCDVAIIGAGITGALIARSLVAEGFDTVVVDRRDVASGSTSASTALLTWELDTHHAELARLEGRETADRVYRLSAEAVERLGEVARSVREPTFQETTSLYLASRAADVPFLKMEARARRRLGLPAKAFGKESLRRRFGVARSYGVHSERVARVDPYGFAHRLFDEAKRSGLRVYDRTRVTSIERTGRRLRLATNRGAALHAEQVVVAAGYEGARFLPHRRLVHLHSTFAVASEPVPDARWVKTLPLVWETARPYLYVRSTADGRVLVGGADERYIDARRRDRALPQKARRLSHGFSRLFPGRELEVAYRWGGVFGDTADGLAYVGSPPELPGIFFSLGYGANGIVLAEVAAGILPDLLRGRPNAAARLFRFDRRQGAGGKCPSCGAWSGSDSRRRPTGRTRPSRARTRIVRARSHGSARTIRTLASSP